MPITPRILTEAEQRDMAEINWWHTIPVGVDEGGGTVYTPGKVPVYDYREFGIPEDLRGKTVLDIGSWDGFFTWTCEKLGGEVTSIDTASETGGNWGGPRGWEFCRRVLDSRARLIYPLSIYDLPPELEEKFDVVLNFGVLYHLHHPMLALEKTFRATKRGGLAIFETAYDRRSSMIGLSHWSLWPGTDNDPTNFFYPTIKGLEAALQIEGFTDCRLHRIRGPRFNPIPREGRMVMTARRP
jgi:tRNA (mo5U34)-methyltransferase